MSGELVPSEMDPSDLPFADQAWSSPWMPRFLEAMALKPNVSAAAKHAGVTHQGARKAAKRDPAFAAAWLEAKRMGVDVLEGIAHQRATTGQPFTETRTTVKRVQMEDGSFQTVEETVTTTTSLHVSDTLMARLLSAHRPELYARSVDVHVFPGSPHDPPRDVGVSEAEAIYRMPDRERALELARALLAGAALDEVELADGDVIDLDGDVFDAGP